MNQPVNAVLDRSAMESYARGYVHVGELLIEIADEGGRTAVPAQALQDAHARSLTDERARALLRVLVTLEGVVVLDLDAAATDAVAPVIPLAGEDVALAHAAWAANAHRARYLTTEPEAAALVPAGHIHTIPKGDV